MGKRGPKPKPVAAPPLKAKGKGPVKRTPTSAFDAAANDTGCHCLKGGDMGVSHPAINSLLIRINAFKNSKPISINSSKTAY